MFMNTQTRKTLKSLVPLPDLQDPAAFQVCLLLTTNNVVLLIITNYVTLSNVEC